MVILSKKKTDNTTTDSNEEMSVFSKLFPDSKILLGSGNDQEEEEDTGFDKWFTQKGQVEKPWEEPSMVDFVGKVIVNEQNGKAYEILKILGEGKYGPKFFSEWIKTQTYML